MTKQSVAADETTRLRNELHIAQEWSARVIAGHEQDINEITALRAENERLRAELHTASDMNAVYEARLQEQEAQNAKLVAALSNVMVGGNSLAQIIGADHPPHGTPYGEALAYYGSGVKYEAWCCWNSIMQARAALAKMEKSE